MDMPEKLVEDLIAEARKRGQLATGYRILYYALFRHSHLSLLCRGDVVFLENSDEVMGHELLGRGGWLPGRIAVVQLVMVFVRGSGKGIFAAEVRVLGWR
jgi:hypothetical protein